MPTPKKGESRNDYMKRCIPIMHAEGTMGQAAIGKCEGMFTAHMKKNRKPEKASPMPRGGMMKY